MIYLFLIQLLLVFSFYLIPEFLFILSFSLITTLEKKTEDFKKKNAEREAHLEEDQSPEKSIISKLKKPLVLAKIKKKKKKKRKI